MAVDLGPRSYPTRSGRIIQNVLPNILMLEPDIRKCNYLAFSQRLKSRSTMQEKVTYDVDEFLPITDTTSAAVTGTTAETIPVSNANYFRPNALWQNQRTSEVMHVREVNVGSGNITVTRAVSALNSGGGTAAAAINSGDTLLRISVAMSETTPRQVTHTRTPSEVFNFAQQTRWDLKLTRRQMKRAFENEDEMPRELTKMMDEVRMDTDRMHLFGERGRWEDDNGDDITLAGGMRPFITSNVFAVGGTLFKSAFDDFLETNGFAYGSMTKMLFCSKKVISALGHMLDSIARFNINTSGDKNVRIGSTVLHYQPPTDGELYIVEDRNITLQRSGEAYGIDMNQLERRHFSNNGFSGLMELIRQTQDKGDVGQANTIIQDECITMGDERNHFMLSGVDGGSYAVTTV